MTIRNKEFVHTVVYGHYSREHNLQEIIRIKLKFGVEEHVTG